VCFILPFFILLNRKIKTIPKAMIVLCSVVIAGMWLEHYLLLGPALSRQAAGMPVAPVEVGVALGFVGLLMAAVFGYFNQFPEMLESGAGTSD
jgi:membrane protease YdiL (CAAX protease family)